MKIKLTSIVLLFFLLLSCRQVVIKIDKIPANTPKGAYIYVTGNFNYWNTSEQRFMMKKASDGKLYVTLPSAFGKIEYKFTRGDWTSVEADICGNQIDKRFVEKNLKDTISTIIESWYDLEAIDCETATIIIEKLPENTPKTDEIAVTGTFNNWQTSEKFILKKRRDGKHEITIPKISSLDKYEFKFTRGNLTTVETDKFGNEISNRKLEFGKKDTLFYSIENWKDIAKEKKNTITIIVTNLPFHQSEMDEIFITGTFNYWYPADRKYQLNKNKDGKYEVSIPKSDQNIEFKFTRGDWSMQEVDKNGNIIQNRKIDPKNTDTAYIIIEKWIDRLNVDKISVFIIDSMPAKTPASDKLYFFCNYNGWNFNDKNWVFNPDGRGKYIFKHYFNKNSEIEFKITRGSWENVEVDKIGYEIKNRKINSGIFDTVHIQIENWKDIKPINTNKIVLLITKYPKNTPPDDNIYCAGTFNQWNPEDNNSVCHKRHDGMFEFILTQDNSDRVEFKFTRGGWKREETNKYFEPISNRYAPLGFIDTLKVEIVSWRDIRK